MAAGTSEATTFDLLPWGGLARVVDPSAPVPGARLDFSATAYCKGKTTASGAEVRTGIAAADVGTDHLADETHVCQMIRHDRWLHGPRRRALLRTRQNYSQRLRRRIR